MSNLIELNPRREGVLLALPADIFALRWRIKTTNGVEVVSAWTPEHRHPSMSKTLADLQGRIDWLFVDGSNRYKSESVTFLRCPGKALKDLSYKGATNGRTGVCAVTGIEVEDVEGNRYLITRDGTVNTFKPERSKAHVSNDN